MADRLLADAITRCPGNRDLLLELAALRIRQGRPAEAAATAEGLLRAHPGDVHGWEILAAGRFLAGDEGGALRAWNRIGRPLVTEVRVTGGERIPARTLDRALHSASAGPLSPGALALARRRMAALPSAAHTRVDVVPGPEGSAALRTVVVPRPPSLAPPEGVLVHGLRAGVSGELEVGSGAPLKRGEHWTARFVWRRPVRGGGVDLALPALSGPGVWHAGTGVSAGRYARSRPAPGLREGQSTAYPAPLRSERRSGAVAVSAWSSARLGWKAGASVDRWVGRGDFLGLLGGAELRSLHDQAALRVDAAGWWPSGSGEAFRSISARGRLRSPPSPRGFEWEAASAIVRTGRMAPPDLWPSAGGDPSAAFPLRARSLLDSDGVAGGPFLAPGLVHGSLEARRWLVSAGPVRVGLGGFVDAARARGHEPGGSPSVAVDAGGGLRLSVPGLHGAFRADVGTGLTDGSWAVSVGWTPAWPGW